jgi:pyridoxal phosphate enzyme (YggS family)
MLKENYISLKKQLPQEVCLVAVSKTKSINEITEIYQAGQRIFGENKVQEMCEKEAVLPKDIEWHMIGHLQSNKIKYIAPFVALIHGVDSAKLLKEINKEGEKIQRIIPCLLQFHIAQEETKFGLSFEEAKSILSSKEFLAFKNIELQGVMGMASFTKNQQQLHNEFVTLRNYFQTLKKHFFKNNPNFSIISMGMSGDYAVAIEEGSNMVRIGSAIFGNRG